MSKKVRMQLGALIILAALGYIVLHGSKNFSQYFVSVNQYRAHYQQFAGKVLRVNGTMESSTVHYNPQTSTLRFTLSSNSTTLPVVYQGAMPNEQFRNADAIVEGKMENGVFHASKLMVKCPNHYSPAPSVG